MRTVRGVSVMPLCRRRWPLPSSASRGQLTRLSPRAAVAPKWQATAATHPWPTSTPCPAHPALMRVQRPAWPSVTTAATWPPSSSPRTGARPGPIRLRHPVSPAVHCLVPVASRLLRRRRSGMMKSSNGGATWTIQDSSFPAESISCFTIDECTAVGGTGIVRTTDGATWMLKSACWTEPLDWRVLPQLPDLRCGRNRESCRRSSALKDGTSWSDLEQPSVRRCLRLLLHGTTCVAAGIARAGVGHPSDWRI